jgi:hypothetical protein
MSESSGTIRLRTCRVKTRYISTFSAEWEVLWAAHCIEVVRDDCARRQGRRFWSSGTAGFIVRDDGAFCQGQRCWSSGTPAFVVRDDVVNYRTGIRSRYIRIDRLEMLMTFLDDKGRVNR